MSKKLIFVGPSNAGKTTIRKVFFEGENSSKLLQYALEPTFGQESIIFNLFEENIGVFDLAGQKNKRWLESEDKKIFKDTSIIVIVIEVNSKIEEVKGFSKRVLELRNELAQSSKVYLFIHKIDLLDQMDLQILKREIKESLNNLNLTKIFLTSIKSKYLIQTFSYLINIIRSNLDQEISKNIIDSEFLNEIIRLLYYLDKEVVLTEKDIQLKLNISNKMVEDIISHLLDKKHINYTKTEGNKIYDLTDKGRTHFEYITKNFDLNNLYTVENDIFIPEFPTKQDIPPFIGLFISDENGRTFTRAELYKGALNEYLKNRESDNIQTKPFDIELIPMFISALEKFSREINIKNLSGFNLQGINLKMQIMNFRNYTITFFLNPEINIISMEYEIKEFFLNLLDKYGDQFNSFQSSGASSKGTQIGKELQNWLENTNKAYNEMIMKLESYDIKNGVKLYRSLDDLQDKVDVEFGIIKEKIKKIKINLMKAIINKNFDRLKGISKKIQEIKLKFLS
jgi:predicted transcriptional regulator